MNASTINPQYALFREEAQLTDTTRKPSLFFPNSFSCLLGLLNISKCEIKHSSLHHDAFPRGI